MGALIARALILHPFLQLETALRGWRVLARRYRTPTVSSCSPALAYPQPVAYQISGAHLPARNRENQHAYRVLNASLKNMSLTLILPRGPNGIWTLRKKKMPITANLTPFEYAKPSFTHMVGRTILALDLRPQTETSRPGAAGRSLLPSAPTNMHAYFLKLRDGYLKQADLRNPLDRFPTTQASSIHLVRPYTVPYRPLPPSP